MWYRPFNLVTQEAETGRWQVEGLPERHRKYKTSVGDITRPCLKINSKN